MEKLIKSFVVIKESHGLKVGEIISIRKHQAQIPLHQDELYFQSERGGQTFTFKFLNSELGKTVKVHESFSSLHDKFDHIS